MNERGPATTGSRTVRRSATVAGWTMVSRLTGLLRIVVIGAVLGPTFFANAFLSANTVPNLVYTALAGPILALVLVPALVRMITDHGVAESGRVLGRVSGYLLAVSGVTAIALVCASPLVAMAVTAGIPDEHARDHAWRLTAVLVVLVAPQVPCYTLAAIGAAVQQARGRFALAAAAPALENVGLIATMVAAGALFRPGVHVPDVPPAMVLLLGAGSTLSVAAHAAAQLIGARRAGLPVTVRRGWKADPATGAVIARLRRSVIVAAFPSVSMFAMLAVAATVPGGVFVFQAAMSVYFVIAAVGAKAVTVAALPGMSAAVEARDAGRFGSAWRQALDLSVVASLPALVLLVAFADLAAGMLANGESRDAGVVGWLAACLVVFAVAQFFDAVSEVGRQALFARLDVRGPRVISTVSLAVRLAGTLAALLLPAGQQRLVGLCVAVLLADLVATVVALVLVRAAIRPSALLDTRRLGAIGAATLAMLPAAAAGWWLAGSEATDRVPRLLLAGTLGAVSAACFGLVLAWLTGRLPAVVTAVRARLPGV